MVCLSVNLWCTSIRIGTNFIIYIHLVLIDIIHFANVDQGQQEHPEQGDCQGVHTSITGADRVCLEIWCDGREDHPGQDEIRGRRHGQDAQDLGQRVLLALILCVPGSCFCGCCVIIFFLFFVIT